MTTTLSSIGELVLKLIYEKGLAKLTLGIYTLDVFEYDENITGNLVEVCKQRKNNWVSSLATEHEIDTRIAQKITSQLIDKIEIPT